MKRSLFIFGFLTDGDVEWLANVAERREFRRGDAIIRQGEHSGLLMFLIDGAAAVTTGSRRVATVSSGDVLGEISLFDSRPPSATVTALDDVAVLGVPFDVLRARLGADPEFASRLYFSLGTLLSQRMREWLGSPIEDVDEIDPEVMEKVALAGRRLEMMRDRALAMR